MNNSQFTLIKKFINGDYCISDITTINHTYKFYIDSINKLDELNLSKLSYENIVTNISDSIYIDEYLYLMKNIESDRLYKSYIHGINHNIRVSIFALIISVYEAIPLEDFKLIIETAKYHDIGRSNDSEDKDHGLISSKNIKFLKDTYNEEEMIYLRTIIQCHSLNDDLFYEIASKNKVDNIERCKKMFNILKDSDGLDRVRLEYPLVKNEFIRTETAKKLIPFAYELFENYMHNLEVIEYEERINNRKCKKEI